MSGMFADAQIPVFQYATTEAITREAYVAFIERYFGKFVVEQVAEDLLGKANFDKLVSARELRCSADELYNSAHIAHWLYDRRERAQQYLLRATTQDRYVRLVA